MLAACGTDSTSAETATTMTTTPNSTVTQAPSDPVVDVDPALYDSGSGRYRFHVAGSPRRECVIVQGSSGAGTSVYCSVTFPDGTPDVTAAPFSGPPNTVVLTGQGSYPTITEGGPPGAALLAVNSRLTVDDATCTAVPGGFDCTVGPSAARFVDGKLTLAGPQVSSPAAPPSAPTSTAPVTTAFAPMDHYTDGTTPAAPGSLCGAATGRRLVTVVTGAISCADALDVLDTYRGLPPGDYGNANIREFDGWTCASPTAARSREVGYGTQCTKGDIELTTPLGGS